MNNVLQFSLRELWYDYDYDKCLLMGQDENTILRDKRCETETGKRKRWFQQERELNVMSLQTLNHGSCPKLSPVWVLRSYAVRYAVRSGLSDLTRPQSLISVTQLRLRDSRFLDQPLTSWFQRRTLGSQCRRISSAWAPAPSSTLRDTHTVHVH